MQWAAERAGMRSLGLGRNGAMMQSIWFHIHFVRALLAAFLLASQSSCGTRMEHIEPGNGEIGSLEGDRQVLAHLRKAGADLSKPTDVRYYVYFSERSAADSAAAQVGPGPLSARVQRAANDSAWLCLVSGDMVPSEQAIREYTTRLVALAKRYRGEYDGWEAAVQQ